MHTDRVLTRKIVPLLLTVATSLALAASGAAATEPDHARAAPLVVGDPRGDTDHSGDARPRDRRAADILWIRYNVVDRQLRVTWRIVDMTRTLTPILEIEGKMVDGRRFTADLQRWGRDRPFVEYWVGADERNCRGLGGFVDRGRDVAGFWLPVRCLPDGRFAGLKSYVMIENDPFASDEGRRVTVRVR